MTSLAPFLQCQPEHTSTPTVDAAITCARAAASTKAFMMSGKTLMARRFTAMMYGFPSETGL